MEYSIGDLSKISRISGKTLHLYHQIGLVVPSRVDKFTLHRYYDEGSLHRVEIIHRFKKLGLPVEIIKDMLGKHKDSRHLVKAIQNKLPELDPNWEKLGITRETIETFAHQESANPVSVGEPTIKTQPDLLIASKQFKGKLSDIDGHLHSLLEVCGKAACGTPFSLFLDDHQFDEEMNIECCVPVIESIPTTEVQFRTLHGTKAVSVQYEGSYDRIWMGYKKAIDYLNKERLAIQAPSREIYLDKPGISITDNQTSRIEIQFLIGDLNDPGSSRLISKPGFGIDAQFDL